jgi:hypothetical protein
MSVIAQLLAKEIDLAIEADIRHEVLAFVSDFKLVKAAMSRIGVNGPALLKK